MMLSSKKRTEWEYNLYHDKDVATLSILLSTLILVPFLIAFGNVGNSTQMVLMYLCTAAILAIIFTIYKMLAHITSNSRCMRWVLGEECSIGISVVLSVVCCGFVIKEHIFSGLSSMPVYGIGACIAICFVYTIFSLTMYRMVMAAKGEKLMIAISSVFACLLIICYTYTPNIINALDFERVHYGAVEHAIYNIAFDQPFTMENSSIYGHYSIFFWPIVKLFGHKPQVISAIFCCGNLIMEAAFIVLVCKGVKNNVVRCLAVLASASFVGATSWSADFYHAGLFPLRLIFPMLILAYTVCCLDCNKLDRKRELIGYALCGMAMVWNLDSGAVATAAYSINIWCVIWRRNRGFSRTAITSFLFTILGCGIAFLEMLAVINVYNVAVGGSLIFRTCFFPLVGATGTSVAEFLRTDMSAYGLSWLIPIIVFTIAVASGLFSCMHDEEKEHAVNSSYFLLCTAIMGLGQSYYFLNRSVNGWFCVWHYLFLCLALSADKLTVLQKTKSMYQLFTKTAGVLSVIYLCVFSVNVFIGAPSLMNATISTKLNSMDSMERLADQVRSIVPKDTYAYGRLTQELYAYMGWDPGYHQRDPIIMEYYGMGLEGYSEAVKEINAQSSLLVDDRARGVISPDTGLFLAAQIPNDAPELYYYAPSVTYAYNQLGYTDENALLNTDDRAILRPGFTQYGPYLQMNPGHYHVEVRGKNLDGCSYDTVYNIGANVVETTLLQHTNEMIVYEFDLSELAPNIECRTFNNSQDDAEIVSITISH